MIEAARVESFANNMAHQRQSEYEEQPISRTYQYRKVMKPMLERKRRARINRCLDELKDLMVGALQAEGENVSKLEKADVLELTVRHLHKLKRQQMLGLTPEATYADRFKAGFTHCATEASKYLSAVPGIDMGVSARLVSHLGYCLRQMERPSPAAAPVQLTVSTSTYTPPSSPNAYQPVKVSGQYCVVPVITANPVAAMSVSPTPSDSGSSVCSDSSAKSCNGPVWRPW